MHTTGCSHFTIWFHLKSSCQFRIPKYTYAVLIESAQCRLEGVGGEAATNYRGPAIRKGARDPIMLHMFLSLSIVPLFVECRD